MSFVASLLSVSDSFLQSALEVRSMETKHGAQRGTSYKVPYNYVQVFYVIYIKIFNILGNCKS